MRSAKESEYFPYLSKLVCYIEVYKDGQVQQVPNSKTGISKAYDNVKNGNTVLYAVWPGNWRSDLFIIDDPDALAEAFGIG